MKKQSYNVDIIGVAKAAGVSPATVSRTINHPSMVNPATRRKVENAIRKTGYIRNRAAQVMHGRRSASIGLVVPTVNYSIFAELVQSFNDSVSQEGFALLLATHDYDLGKEYQLLRKFLEHRVDGVALVGQDHSEDSFRLLESQNIPVISVWNHVANSRISCIGSDNDAAGREAAEHILSLGHQDIGLLFPPTGENDRARGRIAGVLDALTRTGIRVKHSWQIETLYSIAESKEACSRLLANPQRPTALICGNDIIAHGAIAAAHQLGLRVPQDMSIIGIGDFPGSADMVPALTTIRIPAREIGQMAARHLTGVIGSDEQKTITRINTGVELKVRQTTGRFEQALDA